MMVKHCKHCGRVIVYVTTDVVQGYLHVNTTGMIDVGNKIIIDDCHLLKEIWVANTFNKQNFCDNPEPEDVKVPRCSKCRKEFAEGEVIMGAERCIDCHTKESKERKKE